MSAVAALILMLVAVVATCAVWRWASLPCPWWMVPLLENPYFQLVAGAELLMDRAGIGAGMRVLDAGCGPGRLTIPIAGRVGEAGRVVAIDRQPRMLRRLQTRIAGRGLANVEVVLGKLGDGLLPAEAFDVALLVTVLGEIPDKAAALVEIRSALRDGGVLSVTEVLPDPHYLSLARVRALAAEAGLHERQVFGGRVGTPSTWSARAAGDASALVTPRDRRIARELERCRRPRLVPAAAPRSARNGRAAKLARRAEMWQDREEGTRHEDRAAEQGQSELHADPVRAAGRGVPAAVPGPRGRMGERMAAIAGADQLRRR